MGLALFRVQSYPTGGIDEERLILYTFCGWEALEYMSHDIIQECPSRQSCVIDQVTLYYHLSSNTCDWLNLNFVCFCCDYRIAKLDKRIGNCTVLACNKWQPIFAECEATLGFSGDAANDVMSAWSKLARDTFQTKTQKNTKHSVAERRSNSLTRMYGRSVRLPVDLIPLERARALTSTSVARDDAAVGSSRLGVMRPSRSLSQSSDSLFPSSPPTSIPRPEISQPLNLEESVYTSPLLVDPFRLSPSPYAPQADTSPLSKVRRPHSDPQEAGVHGFEDTVQTDSGDAKASIQEYVDKVNFNALFP